jgi:hypothetical protein
MGLGLAGACHQLDSDLAHFIGGQGADIFKPETRPPETVPPIARWCELPPFQNWA